MTAVVHINTEFDAFDPTNFEALVGMGVVELDIRLAILGAVIRECMLEDDKRWLELDREQVQPLMAARTEAIRRKRIEVNVPEPEPVKIVCKTGLFQAIGEAIG